MARNLRNTIKGILEKNAVPIEEASFILCVEQKTLEDFLQKKCHYPKERLLHVTQIGLNPEEFIREPYVPKLLMDIAATVLFMPDAALAYNVLSIPIELYQKFYDNDPSLYCDDTIRRIAECCPDMTGVHFDKILSVRRELYGKMISGDDTDSIGQQLREIYNIPSLCSEEDFVDFDDPVPTATEEALREKIEELTKMVERLNKSLGNCRTEIHAYEQRIKDLEGQNAELYSALQDKDKQVHKLSNQLNTQEDNINQLSELREKVYVQAQTIEQ